MVILTTVSRDQGGYVDCGCQHVVCTGVYFLESSVGKLPLGSVYTHFSTTTHSLPVFYLKIFTLEVYTKDNMRTGWNDYDKVSDE